MTRIIILCLLCLVPMQAHATKDMGLLRREAILENIIQRNSRHFNIPPQLIKAIMRQESDCRPLVVNVAGKDYHPKSVEAGIALARHADSSGLQYDIGLMQINRYWVRKYRIPYRLLFDPRENIYMGCFILSNEIRKHGMTWRAIGNYHSHTPWRNADYSRRIRRHLADIITR